LRSNKSERLLELQNKKISEKIDEKNLSKNKDSLNINKITNTATSAMKQTEPSISKNSLIIF
jgi:hypothetical protein